MRPSPFRHTLAILRTTLGFTQKEMAGLLGCSTPTIQAVELGKLQLSEKLGGIIALKTGVSLDWLLRNDVTQPPADHRGAPYTTQTFDATRAFSTQEIPPFFSPFQPALSFRTNVYRLASLLLRAFKDKKTHLCAYKVARALDELEREFSVSDADKLLFPQPVAWNSGKPCEREFFMAFVRAAAKHVKFSGSWEKDHQGFEFMETNDGQMRPSPNWPPPTKAAGAKPTPPHPSKKRAPRKR